MKMKNTAQSWFLGGPSSSGVDQQKSPSLLADWNAYAASQDSDSSALGFDIEAAVSTTSDKVSGTFNVVSKRVRDLPGSFQSATSNIPSGISLMHFGVLLAAGVFFIFIAFTMFLPVIVLVPQKFAICFTIGCALIVGSFFALKGPRNQLAHMSSKELCQFITLYLLDKHTDLPLNSQFKHLSRLPFTLGFVSSMVGTIYVSMWLHSYVLSVLFSVLQVVSLSYYAISYFPGGSSGLKFLSSSLASSVFRCFGR